MGFTTTIFLFLFLPIFAGIHFIIMAVERNQYIGSFVQKYRLSDVSLLGLSLCFYGWSCFDDIFKLCIYILSVYGIALLIHVGNRKKIFLEFGIEWECAENLNGRKTKRFIKKIRISGLGLLIGSALLLGILFYYKYFNFSLSIFNRLFHRELAFRSIWVPLGISFITFSAISYLADIYQGIAEPGSLVDCALYLAFFPKLVSGPIVLWRDFRPQISRHKIDVDRCVRGINRIMIGFAKKLILADMFGLCINDLQNASVAGIDTLSAWGGAFLFMLQIYYDFAGYSDIVLGLSTVLGYDLKENFRFPYRSQSLSEFWRRWHISLGTWFREYVYIPLGGSRRGYGRTLLHLAIVFALTGLWHGASWNYILWGTVNGGFVLLERIFQDKWIYRKTPGMIKWLCTMFITMMCWEMFRFHSIAEFMPWFNIMIGKMQFESIQFTWRYYFDNRMIILTLIGIVGATIIGEPAVLKAYHRFSETKAGFLIHEEVLLGLFGIAILCMVNSSYSPFIYFQY